MIGNFHGGGRIGFPPHTASDLIVSGNPGDGPTQQDDFDLNVWAKTHRVDVLMVGKDLCVDVGGMETTLPLL